MDRADHRWGADVGGSGAIAPGGEIVLSETAHTFVSVQVFDQGGSPDVIILCMDTGEPCSRFNVMRPYQ